MKRIGLLFVALSPFVLASCKPQAKFKDLQTGDRVIITAQNVQNYLKISLKKPSLSKDKEGSITAIKYKLSTEGYTELSYFIDIVSCKITFDYLGDDGNTTEYGIGVSVNPGKDGKATNSDTYSCNYRNVTNFRLTNFECEGFVVKK